MNKLAKLTWLALAFVTMIGLSACGESGPEVPVNPTQEAQEETSNYNVSENLYVGVKKLPDGRTVTCVTYMDYRKGGLSCDFANAK